MVISVRQIRAQCTRRDQGDAPNPASVEMAQQIGRGALRAAEDVGDMQNQQVNIRLLQHIGEARLQPPENINTDAQRAHGQQRQPEPHRWLWPDAQ